MYNSTEETSTGILNEGSQRQGVLNGTSVVVNLVVFMFGFIVFLCDTVTCVAMARTKRVPHTTRILTCTIFFCDGTYVLLFLLAFITSRAGLQTDELVISLVSEIGRICMTVTYVSIALMSLERVFCLNFGNYYSRYINNKTSYTFVFITLGGTVVLKLLIRYVFIPLYKNSTFDFVENSGDLKINLCVLGVSLAISIACYVNIYVIIRSHSRRMKTIRVRGAVTSAVIVSRSYYSTRAVRVIFAFFIAIHLPLLITLIAHNSKADDSFSRFLVLASVITMSGTNPILYAWRFKECRYILKSFFYKRFGLFADSISAMRIEVYSIVINEGPSRTSACERNNSTPGSDIFTTTESKLSSPGITAQPEE